jgi:RimJ/RimL family protein N-acetyltransferase
MSEDRSSRSTEREENALMPRSAPPPKSRSQGRGEEERGLAMLQAEVHALAHDIAAARSRARRSPDGLGLLLRGRREPRVPIPHGELVRLRDGASIFIRPIEPEDADQLRTGFQRLSALSRYRRFLTEFEQLTPHQLEYLTHIDHTDHEALGALVAATGAGVGTARFIRDPSDRATAEVAVVVADGWQGRGVGTALLERLTTRARAAGIDSFTARMLAGNEPARRLLTRIGDLVSERDEAGTIELKLRLR